MVALRLSMRAEQGTIDPRHGYARADRETLGTAANVITGLRTVAAVVVAMLAAERGSLSLLLVSLAIYWIGDMADGAVARLTDHETRIGAVLDILSDRFCAAAFYVGLAWLEPELWLPIAIYLAEFMVVDAFISLAFLAWPLASPNYFFVVDRKLWLWNWSKPGKAVNSAAFAVLLVITGNVWLGVVIAVALLTLKVGSLIRLARIGLPVPATG